MLLWALGAPTLAVSAGCGGKSRLARQDRAPDRAGTGGDTTTSSAAATTRASRDGDATSASAGMTTTLAAGGGASSTDTSTGGIGGFIGFLQACPEYLEAEPCGGSSFTGERFREMGCEFTIVPSDDLYSPPYVFVDCEVVSRFVDGEGGAPGQIEVEQYTWDEDTGDFAFSDSVCDGLNDDVRVDVYLICPSVL